MGGTSSLLAAAERPHLVVQDGQYYLWTISHMFTFAPGLTEPGEVAAGPDGVYGHPDHIAICQFTTAAIVHAAARHVVDKLYYLAWSEALFQVE